MSYVIGKVIEDVKGFNLSNDDETKVLRSNYISAYKGSIVVRTSGNRSGSLGVLMISRDTIMRADKDAVIRHEYGHTFQLKQLAQSGILPL